MVIPLGSPAFKALRGQQPARRRRRSAACACTEVGRSPTRLPTTRCPSPAAHFPPRRLARSSGCWARRGRFSLPFAASCREAWRRPAATWHFPAAPPERTLQTSIWRCQQLDGLATPAGRFGPQPRGAGTSSTSTRLSSAHAASWVPVASILPLEVVSIRLEASPRVAR
jgi:hypothetical protein